MNRLVIRQAPEDGVTVIPDRFLDTYLSRADGECIKTYLLLLRMIKERSVEPTLSYLAGRLGQTEEDVLAHLRFWESRNLLILLFDGTGALSAIDLQPLPEESSERTITIQRISELAQRAEVREMLDRLSGGLGRVLTRKDTECFLSFYDELHFPVDLIEYLADYCMQRGKKSIHYIERVALSWHEKGITSVEEAMASESVFPKAYYDVMKTLGFGGRQIAPAEAEILRKWFEEYRLPDDLIREACTRTVLRARTPSIRYADRILSSWKKEGVTSRNDVLKLDLEHEQKKTAAAKTGDKKKGSFQAFGQREYDDKDVEAKLLRAGRAADRKDGSD